jgi:hypothetical protein
MSNTDPNRFLMEQGGKSFPFERIGDCAVGEIISSEVRQQTDLDTGEKLTWPDGSPRNQLVITLQTAEHTSDDDDGIRTIYAKGGKYDVAEGEGTSMKDAIAQAVREAGGDGVYPGDKLWVAYSGNGVKKNRGFNAPKLYAAKYEKAVRAVTGTALFGQD